MVVAAHQIIDLSEAFQYARKRLTLSAFEFFSQQAVDAVIAHTRQHTSFKDAFTNPAPVYGLLEFDTPHNPDAIADFFDHCQTSGWVCDAIISQSERQSKELWQLRENISESLSPYKPLKHDVAVRLEKLPEVFARLDVKLAE